MIGVGHLVVGAVVGLWVNSQKPKSSVVKSKVIGGASGREWNVEFFRDLDVMVLVEGPQRIAFKKTTQGWKLAKAKAHPNVIKAARKDFEKNGTE